MIKLIFKINNELIRIRIDNRQIYYSDRLFEDFIKLIPPDKDFIKKINMSRNKYPQSLKDLFILTKKEEEEYNNCKSDEDLADLSIRDIKNKNGGKLISIEKDGI